MKLLLSTVLAFAALMAYAQDLTQIGGKDPQQHGPAVQWRTVAEGVNSRIPNGDQRIITNLDEWNKLYSRMAGQAGLRAPELCDFTKQDLLVFHTGNKPTAGYRIYVQTIGRPRVGVKEVDIRIVSPRRDIILPQQVISPYVIIAVDRAPGNYVFKATNVYGSIQAPPQQGHGHGGACGCTCGNCCHNTGHNHTYGYNNPYGNPYAYNQVRTYSNNGVIHVNNPFYNGRELFPPLNGGNQGHQGHNGGHTVQRMYNGTIVSSGTVGGEICPPLNNGQGNNQNQGQNNGGGNNQGKGGGRGNG